MKSLGVDIGGTKVLAAVVDDRGAIIARSRRPTADTIVGIENAIIEAITELTSTHEVDAVGIAAAGFISDDRATILSSPNIPSWNGVTLTTPVADATGLAVLLENDANAAAWGEARFGAAANCDNVLMVTVGTGIGGGIILDGQMVRGGYGIAAEIGHMCVLPDGRQCGCGQQGCLEQYASGSALVRVARELTGQEYTGQDITEAARNGEEFAHEAFRTIGLWLGRGLASAAALLDPTVVVIGGGVGDAGEILLKPVRAAFAQYLPGSSGRPHADIVVATLGSDAGVIGAADLARSR